MRTPEMSMFELVHSYDTINLHRSGAAVKLELNRPERLNALSDELAGQLLVLLQEVAEDPSARSVLITGAGRAFCGGADIRQPAADGAARPEVRKILGEVYHPILRTIRQMPKPVICAANGAVAGVGNSLALGADLVIAAESAYFLLAYVNIGIAPDGGTFLLAASRMGFARATEMAMLGERISARQALDWGLINQVWPDTELQARAEELALRMANGPTRSYAGIKRELNNSIFAQLDEALEVEIEVMTELRATADAAEGRAAFAEKRAAQFIGR
jgi:2-(1,2-epoxy-1,2-dihydrophenyl)acetyl-CoA isomerase